MQSANILQIPLHRTSTTRFPEAIEAYVKTKYDQHPDGFAQDLKTIEELRRDAVQAVEPHPSAVRKLQIYAAQLMYMGGKFPVDIGANFVWQPSIGYRTSVPYGSGQVRFELANVLFNLGAMYSQLAFSSNRSTSDGLKNAASYYCYAAGVFQYLSSEIVLDMGSVVPEDMDTATLEALKTLMLAQAQECFWQKAVKDGLKDATIAKLAIQVSDLYFQAGEWSLKSESVASEWTHHINAKQHHFAGAAQYRAACDCLEKRKYGEEVARLRISLASVTQALREPQVNNAVTTDLNGLKTRVAEDLRRAERDNDQIYLQAEPHKSELKILERVSMVAAKIPKEVSNSQQMLGDHGELGKALFSKLIPHSVHVAASNYAVKRDLLVNNEIVTQFEGLTLQIHELLESLNLPGSLQALERPLGLPPGIQSRADEVRQAKGVSRLHATIVDTEKVRANNRSLYQEGVDLLRIEAGEDEAARRKYGLDQWQRKPGQDVVPKLYSQITDIDGYMKQAAASDQLVQNKLRENESLIRLLGGTDRDLEDYIPSSRRATMTARVEREANVLRATLNEVNRLENRRRRKIELLRTKAKADDATRALHQEAMRMELHSPLQPIQPTSFEPFFEQRLSTYNTDRQEIRQDELEQQQLLARIEQANTTFEAVKSSTTTSSEREEALQNLENAYTAYKDIIRNLDIGRKFYNDLSAITTRFRDECRSFVHSRRAEAQTLQTDLAAALANLQLHTTPQRQLVSTPKSRPQQQRDRSPEKARTQPTPAIAKQSDPLPAPQPQRAVLPSPSATVPSPALASPTPPGQTTWQEGMPIVFGARTHN